MREALIAGKRLKVMQVIVEKRRLNRNVPQEKRGFKGVKRERRNMRTMLKSHPIKPLTRAKIRALIR